MKAWLGLRDTEDVYLAESGDPTTLFGIAARGTRLRPRAPGLNGTSDTP